MYFVFFFSSWVNFVAGYEFLSLPFRNSRCTRTFLCGPATLRKPSSPSALAFEQTYYQVRRNVVTSRFLGSAFISRADAPVLQPISRQALSVFPFQTSKNASSIFLPLRKVLWQFFLTVRKLERYLAIRITCMDKLTKNFNGTKGGWYLRVEGWRNGIEMEHNIGLRRF